MKPHRIVLVLCVAACVLALMAMQGCASIVRPLEVGGGAGAGAALGSLAGPLGTVGGAIVGGAAAHSFVENTALSDGSLIGESALNRELERHGQEIQKNTDKTHWLTWAVWIALGLVALKWWRTLRTDFYKARNAALPVVASIIHGADVVEAKLNPPPTPTAKPGG